jgi:hypothetical protein
MTNNLIQNDKIEKKVIKKPVKFFVSKLRFTRLTRHSRHEIAVKK